MLVSNLLKILLHRGCIFFVRSIFFCNGAHPDVVVCAYRRVRVDAFVRVGVYARVCRMLLCSGLHPDDVVCAFRCVYVDAFVRVFCVRSNLGCTDYDWIRLFQDRLVEVWRSV